MKPDQSTAPTAPSPSDAAAKELRDVIKECGDHAHYMETYDEPFVGSTDAIARCLKRAATLLETRSSRAQVEAQQDAERWKFGAENGFPVQGSPVTTATVKTMWHYRGCAFETADLAIDAARMPLPKAPEGG